MILTPPIHHYFKSQHYTLLQLDINFSDCSPNIKKIIELINSKSIQDKIKFFINKFGKAISEFKNISINESIGIHIKYLALSVLIYSSNTYINDKRT